MAISLHNSASASISTASSLSANLTAAIGEIVVVSIAQEDVSGAVKTVLSISDGTANVYAKRFSASASGAAEPAFGASEGFEVWWAYVANTLTLGTITVTMSAAIDDAVVIVAGYQGFTGTAYQTAPWDTNAFLPKTAQATTTSAATASGISTTSTAGMLLAGACSSDFSQTQAAPSGFTLVQSLVNSGASNAEQNGLFQLSYSSAQSSITVTDTGPSKGWIFYVDALTDQGSGVTQTLTFDPKWQEGFFSTEIVSYG